MVSSTHSHHASPDCFLDPGAPSSGVVPVEPVPELRLYTEQMVLAGGWGDDLEEAQVPVLSLSFRYGGERVRAGAVGDEVYVPGRGRLPRNHLAEDRARSLIESFGAVEIGCVESYVPSFDTRADYVVRVDGDLHAFCSFGAYALPQLRALGWQVEVADDYPYRVLAADTPWYASVEPDEERADWFSLELGLTIEGRRISLLPALIDLIDRSPDDGTLAALARKSSRFIALPVPSPDGGEAYLPVPAKRLERVLQVLRDLYDGAKSAPLAVREPIEIGFGRHDAAFLSALDTAFEPSGGEAPIAWAGQAELRHLGDALVKGPREEAPPLRTLRATLRPYQQQGVAWLQHLRSLGMGGVLADDMGLGKTLQTIAHLLAEKEAGRMRMPSLIVAPTSLVTGWQREIKRFAPALRAVLLHGKSRHKAAEGLDRADIVITTYNLLWRDEELFGADRQWFYVILDEAQAIKNHRSRAHKAVRALDAEHRLCLTGTPLENHIGELLSLFDFLMPGMLGKPDQLRERYKLPIEQGDDARLAELQRRVAPFILRRLKSEVARDLPAKTEIVRPVDLGDEQRELYESIRVAAHADVRRLIRKKGLAASTVGVLDALMKLRQVCCDPRLVRVPAARQLKRSAKLEVLLELVKQQIADGHRILVFSQFTTMLSLISEGLLAEGVGHLTLTGATQNRQAKVDAFQEGRADVFLISLKAGGTGLTLTGADTVIHYDPWWNPAAQAQATDRAYRIGQTRPVFVYNLIVAGSVEERMLQLQERKRRLASAILGGGGTGGGLRAEDVDDLFAPLD